MIDRSKIKVISGKGGSGSISGRREKYVPRGGPDGGDGGDGGSVIINCDENLSTLHHFRFKNTYRAVNGEHGSGRKKKGKNGNNIDISVPIGTEIWGVGEEDSLMVDLQEHGESVVVAKGGTGGRGNVHFASSTNKFPLFAEDGEPSVELDLRLELKLLADIGIIGVPNVGKSSLLSSVSSARPKIADYPFSTVDSVLGVVLHRDNSFVMLDMPGLIEGAHAGIGLGHEFLRHVERTRILLHMLDGTDNGLLTSYFSVRKELEKFNKKLLTKTEIIVVNKMDVPGARDNGQKTMRQLSDHSSSVMLVSVATREGMDILLDTVSRKLNESTPKANDKNHALPVIKPLEAEKPEIQIQGNKYIVNMPTAIRIAATVNSSDWNAMVQLYDQLRKMGVILALERSGIGNGDVFKVGNIEWEWE
jgi:GTP-binding protein